MKVAVITTASGNSTPVTTGADTNDDYNSRESTHTP